jgi:RNA polymerase sigma-70 factor (ECF subfamily)
MLCGCAPRAWRMETRVASFVTMSEEDHAHEPLSPEATRMLLAQRERFVAFLRHRVGSLDLAEEILHDAYAKALERGGQLRDEESAVAWFFRILRNAIVERARRESAKARALEKLAGELETFEPAEPSANAVCGCVSGVLATLKPEYQASVRAIDLDGRELRAFASEAGVSPNNAAVRLHRAREALRRRLLSTCGACAEHGCIDCTCRH